MRLYLAPTGLGLVLALASPICARAQEDVLGAASTTPAISADGTSVEVRADAVGEMAKHLSNPSRLRSLTVVPVRGVRPDLAFLPRMGGLQTVKLANVAIDDDDLALLAKLPQLSSLDLSGTPITDKGVADHLPRCKNLVELSVASTRVSNASLPFLGKLVRLKRLSLAGTRVMSPAEFGKPLGKESFAYLEPLVLLEELDLRVSINDDDLPALAKLKALKHLRLHWAIDAITIDGLYAFKAKAPQIAIATQVLDRLQVDYLTNEKGEITFIDECWPSALVRLAVAEKLTTVVTLALSDPPSVELVRALPNVRRLTLRHARITPELVTLLASWKSLEDLEFVSSELRCSQAELKPLGGLKIRGLPETAGKPE